MPALKEGLSQGIPELYGSDEVYRDDTSNFWILDRVVLERVIDFAGFRIKKAFPRTGRMSYLCTKVGEFPDAFAAQSKYSRWENRVTNFEPFS